MFRALVVLLAAIGLILYLAWRPPERPGGVTSVALAELLQHPEDYQGRFVRVSGTVIDRASLLGVGGVILADTAGHEILVLGLIAPPRPGSETTISGRFQTLLSVGDIQAPVIVIRENG